jgi:hypothetical protein
MRDEDHVTRIIVEDLSKKLSAFGAVILKGPKSCSKTDTAK